jgi:hypothetical protein
MIHVMNGSPAARRSWRCITGDRPNDPCYEREFRSKEELEMYTGDRPNDPCYERESRSQEELEMYYRQQAR